MVLLLVNSRLLLVNNNNNLDTLSDNVRETQQRHREAGEHPEPESREADQGSVVTS